MSVLLHDVQNEAIQFALYEEISGLARAWETRDPLNFILESNINTEHRTRVTVTWALIDMGRNMGRNKVIPFTFY